jgi:hypothetical protein
MKYHAAKLKRTPPWLTEKHFEQIENFYTHAKIVEDFTGEKQHVDHIEPLRGKDRCGLHVPWNLQILPALENMKKGNRNAEKNSTAPISKGANIKSRNDTKSRAVPTTGFGQDDNHTDNHSGTVRGQDADHCTQEGSGDGMGRGGAEVGTSQTPQSEQDAWELNPTYGWVERTG